MSTTRFQDWWNDQTQHQKTVFSTLIVMTVTVLILVIIIPIIFVFFTSSPQNDGTIPTPVMGSIVSSTTSSGTVFSVACPVNFAQEVTFYTWKLKTSVNGYTPQMSTLTVSQQSQNLWYLTVTLENGFTWTEPVSNLYQETTKKIFFTHNTSPTVTRFSFSKNHDGTITYERRIYYNNQLMEPYGILVILEIDTSASPSGCNRVT